MISPESEKERVPRGWRSVLPAVLSLGIMLALCVVAVKILDWFLDPTASSRPETEDIWAPDITDYSTNTFPPGVEEGLLNAESLVIYLVGVRPRPEGADEEVPGPVYPYQAPQSKDIPTFHGWPIFGSAHVASKQAVEPITRSLIQGVKRYRNEPFACFFPRHGVRVTTRDGWIIDLVICYQCQIMEVYITLSEQENLLAGEVDPIPDHLQTFDDSRQPLNDALRAAGVDLGQEVVKYYPEP